MKFELPHLQKIMIGDHSAENEIKQHCIDEIKKLRDAAPLKPNLRDLIVIRSYEEIKNVINHCTIQNGFITLQAQSIIDFDKYREAIEDWENQIANIDYKIKQLIRERDKKLKELYASADQSDEGAVN